MYPEHPTRFKEPFTLSLVIPCYNEEKTLETCVARVLEIEDDMLSLELVIVDDASTDGSLAVAKRLEAQHPQIRVFAHPKNQGKGAALRTGFAHATGRFVGVQDADLEYNPHDLRRLLVPLLEQDADAVFGSRYLSGAERRVLYFWHSLMNRTLTFLSNMFTDLDLTDMETCYKLFKREVIQSVTIEENRFGFEPEITAKVAQMRGRIFELGVGYKGRTFAEGKKINWKDGVRALYCIFHYNAPKLPLPLQLLIYLFVGGFSALANLSFFSALTALGASVGLGAFFASIAAAGVNYFLCITMLFRHKARWTTGAEIAVYAGVVAATTLVDVAITSSLVALGAAPLVAKSIAAAAVFVANFLGRRRLVFPEPPAGPWRP